MPGLSLSTGLHAGAGGSYTPMTPASSLPSTATISQKAYGISGTGLPTSGGTVPGYGSVGIGALALAGLIYLWWSLPR